MSLQQHAFTSTSTPLSTDPYLCLIADPEAGRENPVEDEHLRLVCSRRSGAPVRELEPIEKERDGLNVSPAKT